MVKFWKSKDFFNDFVRYKIDVIVNWFVFKLLQKLSSCFSLYFFYHYVFFSKIKNESYLIDDDIFS